MQKIARLPGVVTVPVCASYVFMHLRRWKWRFGKRRRHRQWAVDKAGPLSRRWWGLES